MPSPGARHARGTRGAAGAAARVRAAGRRQGALPAAPEPRRRRLPDAASAAPSARCARTCAITASTSSSASAATPPRRPTSPRAGRGVPFVVHEANARPGMANVLGARRAAARRRRVRGHAAASARSVVGMPLRREIVDLDRAALRAEAAAAVRPGRRAPDAPGVRRIAGRPAAERGLRRGHGGAWRAILDAGWQLLHVTGERSELADPGRARLRRCGATSTAWTWPSPSPTSSSRAAGAATVSEISALGIPAVYVPYAVGNGEQALNAASAVAAGAAVLIQDAELHGDRVRAEIVPLLADEARRAAMAEAAASVGTRTGTENVDRADRRALAGARSRTCSARWMSVARPPKGSSTQLARARSCRTGSAICACRMRSIPLSPDDACRCAARVLRVQPRRSSS